MDLIVIVDQNWGIGNEGDQLVYIPQDLKRFQKITRGHSIVLGRKTLETFPDGKPLPKRRNLIVSTREDYEVEGAEVFKNMEELLRAVPEDTIVVGGESVYRQLLPYCDRAYVTKVNRSYQADCYFPNLDQSAHWWIESEEGPFEYEDLLFSYVTYRKT